MSYHHLNFEDRTALMLESRKEGFSARKFAELIKRHPSTIYRELKRNSINDVYQARYASDNTFARRRRGHRKLKIDSILWKFIVEAIRCLWGYAPISSKSPKFALSPVISRATGDILYGSINTRCYYIEKLKFRNPAV